MIRPVLSQTVEVVVWLTGGQSVSSAEEIDVYTAVPVSVPTWTGNEPA